MMFGTDEKLMNLPTRGAEYSVKLHVLDGNAVSCTPAFSPGERVLRGRDDLGGLPQAEMLCLCARPVALRGAPVRAAPPPHTARPMRPAHARSRRDGVAVRGLHQRRCLCTSRHRRT